MKKAMLTLSLSLTLTVTASAQSLFLDSKDQKIDWNEHMVFTIKGTILKIDVHKMTCNITEDANANANVAIPLVNNNEIIGGNDKQVEPDSVIDNDAKDTQLIDSVTGATDDWD